MAVAAHELGWARPVATPRLRAPRREAAPRFVVRRVLALIAVLALAAVAVAAWATVASSVEPAAPPATVVVAPGDTIWDIAAEIAPPGESIHELAARIAADNDVEPARLRPGMVLTVAVE